MKSLLLETSLECALIALIEDDKLLFEKRLTGGPELSKNLGVEIKKILTSFPPPYNRVVTGIGPGSFTGIRVGASMANALAFGWKVPLFTVSSLSGFGPGTILIDGRMGGVYVQNNFEPPKLFSLAEAAELSQPLFSPHPEKILARLPHLHIEKRDLDPLLLVAHATEATYPLKINY